MAKTKKTKSAGSAWCAGGYQASLDHWVGPAQHAQGQREMMREPSVGADRSDPRPTGPVKRTVSG